MAARACSCPGVRRAEGVVDVMPAGVAVGAGVASVQVAGVILAGAAGTAASGEKVLPSATVEEVTWAGARVVAAEAAAWPSAGVGVGVTAAALAGVAGVDGAMVGAGAGVGGSTVGEGTLVSTRGRFGVAAGDEVSGGVPQSGRGGGEGVCVASSPGSELEAVAVAALDGPAPGVEAVGCELSLGGAMCGAASATGAALVKISGTHPASTKWPSPPAVAAAAAAVAADGKPPLW